MGSPAPVGSASAPLRRNLSLDVTSWVGFGITSALLGSILPAMARREGVEPLGIALLAAIPYAASFLSVFAGRIGPRRPIQLAALRATGAIALVLVAVGPGLAWAVMAAAIYWMAHMFGMPVQQRLWGVMYPGQRRGRLLATVTTGRYAAASTALLVAGAMAVRFDGVAIVAVGGFVGAVCALASGLIAAPDLGGISSFSVRRALRVVADRPAVRDLTVAHVMFGGGLAIAVPLLTLVQVDRMDLDLGAIGLLGMGGCIATLVSLMAWGAIADRRGTLVVLQVAGLLGVGGLVLYGAAGSIEVAMLASILLGVTTGAVEVAFALLIANHLPAEQQAAATAGTNALFGLRGMLAPVAMVAALQVGLLDLQTALVLCVFIAGMGALLYLRVPTTELSLNGPWLAGVGERISSGRAAAASGGHAIAAVIGARFASPR